MDTWQYLLDHPSQLWTIAIISVLFGLRALNYLHDLKNAPCSEFYGERLASALNAGRTVNAAPQHKGWQLRVNATARELLGLPERFSVELRRAWLRLVRELHPDRWATAGEGVRQMKEAALKRVNAARDELASQAVG